MSSLHQIQIYQARHLSCRTYVRFVLSSQLDPPIVSPALNELLVEMKCPGHLRSGGSRKTPEVRMTKPRYCGHCQPLVPPRHTLLELSLIDQPGRCASDCAALPLWQHSAFQFRLSLTVRLPFEPFFTHTD